MTRPLAWFALLLTGLVAAGCGSSVAAGQREQQAVLRYEQIIGDINTAAARPTTSPQRVQSQLAAAVRRYATLDAPAVLRPTHRHLLRALRRELRSVRDGLRATTRGDLAGIRAARALGDRSRRAVAAALAQITTQVGKCRAALPACLAPASSSSASLPARPAHTGRVA